MRVPVAWAVALAFLLGLVAGGALVYEGSQLDSALGGGADIPVAVRITNVGTHDVNITIDVAELEGSATGRAGFPLPAGATSTRTYVLASGRVLATISGEWSAPAADGDGTARVTSDTSACDESETLTFIVEIDTTRGVSFAPSRADCI